MENPLISKSFIPNMLFFRENFRVSAGLTQGLFSFRSVFC